MINAEAAEKREGKSLNDLSYAVIRCGLKVHTELEIKAVEHVLPVHKAQLLSYLRLSKRKLGLLINFHVTHLREGISRVVNRI